MSLFQQNKYLRNISRNSSEMLSDPIEFNKIWTAKSKRANG